MLIVFGKLRRKYIHKSYPGHVDIAIVSQDGTVIDRASVKNKMPFIGRSKRKWSSFKAELDIIPPKDSTVIVRFHKKTTDSNQSDCDSNIAIP